MGALQGNHQQYVDAQPTTVQPAYGQGPPTNIRRLLQKNPFADLCEEGIFSDLGLPATAAQPNSELEQPDALPNPGHETNDFAWFVICIVAAAAFAIAFCRRKSPQQISKARAIPAQC